MIMYSTGYDTPAQNRFFPADEQEAEVRRPLTFPQPTAISSPHIYRPVSFPLHNSANIVPNQREVPLAGLRRYDGNNNYRGR